MSFAGYASCHMGYMTSWKAVKAGTSELISAESIFTCPIHKGRTNNNRAFRNNNLFILQCLGF
jgi:hypothetical protein